MKKIAFALLVALAGCATPKPPAPPAPVDPLEAYRPACKERWHTTYAIEKCAQEQLDTKNGLPPVDAEPPAATPAAATPSKPATTTRSSRPAARSRSSR
ncbi:hypothetical protein [Roseomonas elaeocarpi]|uniref:Lipoprotein n=1 Tax=Roseomonas elaeocarpi TaxID=907779 RepID=A0ABV6JQ12_9PROT